MATGTDTDTNPKVRRRKGQIQTPTRIKAPLPLPLQGPHQPPALPDPPNHDQVPNMPGPTHSHSQSSDEKASVPPSSIMNPSASTSTSATSFLGGQPAWVGYAIASGVCAAVNGVFAKLTTTSLTSTLSSHISTFLGLATDNSYVNVGLRGTFFALNLVFNGIMWGLFTAALTKGNSTTRVSIVNVSANFFLTAILGWLIFSEKLPLQWWMGAALLACGNVVIGKREEDEKATGAIALEQSAQDAIQRDGLARDSTELSERDLLELDETSPGSRKSSREEARMLMRGNDIDDPV